MGSLVCVPHRSEDSKVKDKDRIDWLEKTSTTNFPKSQRVERRVQH